MKNKITEILEFLRFEKIKNDRRYIVFAICLLIATALWFLNAMSKDYSTTLNYSVKYINPPQGLFLTSAPPEKFEFKAEAHGFSLLRHKLALSRSPVVLNLNTIYKENSPREKIITLQTQSLISRFSDQVSNEITITDVTPKVVNLIFDSLATKVLPVKPNVETTFKPQFFLKGSINADPDSIKISGPLSVIDTLKYLETKLLKFKDIDAPVERKTALLHPENTIVEQERVILKIQVEKFTEKQITLPLEVINSPEEKNIKVFPSEVKITFLVGMSDYENITSTDFEAFVDFNKNGTNSETLSVTVESKSPHIQMLRVAPQSVEFIIETD